MATTDADPAKTPHPVTSVNTADLTTSPARPSTGGEAVLPGVTGPGGTNPGESPGAIDGDNTDPTTGVGVEGELDVWIARYSKRNFIGRVTVRVLLTVAWLVLAIYTWTRGYSNLAPLTWCALAVVGFFWVALVYRMIQAHYSHYYRLTNRRLFVSTGMIHRRRDMMELLRVKDVFTRQQSLLERWLGLGTVVVVPSEKELPTFYVAGVDDPKEVMDLIWHHARAERDQRSVKVDSV